MKRNFAVATRGKVLNAVHFILFIFFFTNIYCADGPGRPLFKSNTDVKQAIKDKNVILSGSVNVKFPSISSVKFTLPDYASSTTNAEWGDIAQAPPSEEGVGVSEEKIKTDETTGQRYVSDRIVVKFKDDVTISEVEALAEKYELKIVGYYLPEREFYFETTKSVEELKEEISKEEAAESATYDYVLELYSPLYPNDYKYDKYLESVSLPDSWGTIERLGFASQTTIVLAVVDTGINFNKDFMDSEGFTRFITDKAKSFVDSLTFVDSYGHGSAVAGVAAALGNNSWGVVGSDWRVKILPVKIFCGPRTTSVIAALGIRYAAYQGARVINCSFGGYSNPNPTTTDPLYSAVRYANSRGALVVASAGNWNTPVTSPNYIVAPAGYQESLAVGGYLMNATTIYRAPYSNYGSKIEMSAPWHVDCLLWKGTPVCTYNDLYGGTSIAAPFVSGTASLILSINPSFTNEQVRAIIYHYSDMLSIPEFNYRKLNTYKSIQGAIELSNIPPPFNLKAYQLGTTVIKLEWDSVISADEFSIERKSVFDEFFYEITRIKGTKTSYLDKKLLSSTPYEYRLRTVRKIQGFRGITEFFSQYSDIVSVTTLSINAGRWHSKRGISRTPGISAFPSVAIDGQGRIIVAWAEQIPDWNNWEIFLKAFDSGKWIELDSSASKKGQIGGISLNTGNSMKPKIVIYNDGNPFVFWEDNTSGNWEIYAKKWNGVSSWIEIDNSASELTTVGGISRNEGDSILPSVAAKDDMLFVAWSDNSSGIYQIYGKALLPSGKWTEIGGSASKGGISKTRGHSTSPSVAIDAKTRCIWVAWADNFKGNWEIYAKAWNGEKWAISCSSEEEESQPQPITTFTSSSPPQIAIVTSPEGKVTVIWNEAETVKKSEEQNGNWTEPVEIEISAEEIPIIQEKQKIVEQEKRIEIPEEILKEQVAIVENPKNEDERVIVYSDPEGEIHVVVVDDEETVAELLPPDPPPDSEPVCQGVYGWYGLGASSYIDETDWGYAPSVHIAGGKTIVSYIKSETLYLKQFYEEEWTDYVNPITLEGVLAKVVFDVYGKPYVSYIKTVITDQRVEETRYRFGRDCLELYGRMCYVTFYTGRREIHIQKWNGSSWEEYTTVVTTSEFYDMELWQVPGVSLDMALDPWGRIIISWGVSYQPIIHTQLWEEGKWIKLPDISYSGSHPVFSLAVSHKGDVFVAYGSVQCEPGYICYLLSIYGKIFNWKTYLWDELDGSATGYGISTQRYNIWRSARAVDSAFDSSGNIYVVWSEWEYDFYQKVDCDGIHGKMFNGSKWVDLEGSDKPCGISQRWAHSPNIVINNNRAYIFWERVYFDFFLHLRVFELTKLVWSSDISVGNVAVVGLGRDPITVDSSGSPIITYVSELCSGSWAVFVKKFYSRCPVQESICLRPGVSAGWYVVMVGGCSGTCSGNSDGFYFDEEEFDDLPSVSDNSGESIEPAITMWNGYPFVVWADNTPGNFEIYGKWWSPYDGWIELGGSATNGGISNTQEDSRTPAVAVDQLGNIFVAWTEDYQGNFEIYLKYYDIESGKWGEINGSAQEGGISKTPGDSLYPQITIDENNCVIVVWMDNSSGNWETYLDIPVCIPRGEEICSIEELNQGEKTTSMKTLEVVEVEVIQTERNIESIKEKEVIKKDETTNKSKTKCVLYY